METHGLTPPVSALLLTALLWSLTSCSLVLDLQACTDDGECPEAMTCSEEKICQASSQDLTCESDDDCPGPMACNLLGSCQPASSLLDGPCDQAAGDIDDDDAFIIGVLLPLTGAEEGFGRPLFQAIQLAQQDFNGIGGVLGRPLALLICDTEGDDSTALTGAEHLADVGVQAVIGPDYSSQTVDVANRVTIDAGMVLISPSATASTISHLDDNDLVWRTAASDAIQGQALGSLVAFLAEEAPFRQNGDPGQAPKIAILSRSDDTYATGLRQSLLDILPADTLSDPEGFTSYDYPNTSSNDPEDYTGVIASLMAESGPEAEIIVVLGSAEAWTIAEQIDSIATGSPIFVFAEAARNTDRAAAAPETLQGRVWGTAPQNVGDSGYAPYLGFRIKFESAYPGQSPDDLQFVANAFDALYVIALGAAGAGFTGAEIASGMKRLSSGPTIRPNQSDAQSAMNTLSAGGSVDFQGASGPLDFDDNGDPTAGPIILWCFDDKGLPEEGVLVDFDQKFSPHTCGDESDEESDDPFGSRPCDPESVETDCEADEFCNPNGFCEADPGL